PATEGSTSPSSGAASPQLPAGWGWDAGRAGNRRPGGPEPKRPERSAAPRAIAPSADDEHGRPDRIALVEADGRPHRDADAAVTDRIPRHVGRAMDGIAADEVGRVVHRAEVAALPAGKLAIDREPPDRRHGDAADAVGGRIAVAAAGRHGEHG